jgi:hypothetical protein
MAGGYESIFNEENNVEALKVIPSEVENRAVRGSRDMDVRAGGWANGSERIKSRDSTLSNFARSFDSAQDDNALTSTF